MSFSISGIFKPAKQAEPVSNVAPTAQDTAATDSNSATEKVSQAENTTKKQANGGSCCGGCGGGNH
ncbi:hypothetical protein [Shewanella sp. AC34-MNA-CIBAN-0136]|uniref:hypothetical protein n=1 Tax=Shewanella sp. AC34-MNA-CIBAN-0136 TaxID=3140463 RepID=UPI00332F2E46